MLHMPTDIKEALDNYERMVADIYERHRAHAKLEAEVFVSQIIRIRNAYPAPLLMNDAMIAKFKEQQNENT